MTQHRLFDEYLLLIILLPSVHHCSSVYPSFPVVVLLFLDCCLYLSALAPDLAFTLWKALKVNLFPCSFLLVFLFFFLASYFLLIYFRIIFQLLALNFERLFCDL